ncbi:MAG: shikimate dehydrogenase [Fidelibacterota bacterium]|nr:MAG: shikimate dehydrogenase [Candidatus Neomarinimicrobiota bacterium]
MMSFSIIGYPLASTLSPTFYNHLFKLLGIKAHYTVLRPSEKNLTDVARKLREGQLNGINITLPYKSLFMEYLDEIAPDASPVGAVNCVTVNQTLLIGHNTDVTGILCALQQHSLQIGGGMVLLLGAGGAARAAMVALLKSNVNQIHVAGRTATAVTEFVNEFRKISKHTTIKERQLGPELNTSAYNLLINATPVGMWPDTEDSPLQRDQLHREQVIFDLVYNPEETLLIRWALDTGCDTISGIDMFIGQGLASLDHWFPNTLYTPAGTLNPAINLNALKKVLRSALVNPSLGLGAIPKAGDPV